MLITVYDPQDDFGSIDGAYPDVVEVLSYGVKCYHIAPDPDTIVMVPIAYVRTCSRAIIIVSQKNIRIVDAGPITEYGFCCRTLMRSIYSED